jgi:hypothetical protein
MEKFRVDRRKQYLSIKKAIAGDSELRPRGKRDAMDQPKFILKMEEQEDYLNVYAMGIRTRDNVKEITLKVFAAALEKRLKKILIDVRDLTGYFGVTDIYFFVTEVLQDLRGKGVEQVAVVDIRRSQRQGWFLEPVSQNRGINFRVFAEEESARKWLSE